MEHISVKNIRISTIGIALPEHTVSLNNRQIPTAVTNQTASDLAFEASKKIICEEDLSEIGVLIFLTTTPDYRSPASAMVIQKRLGIGVDCIAFDITISKNAFAYGLQVASGLLSNSSKSKALLLLGDTPSKQFEKVADNVFYFADAGAAIVLEKTQKSEFQFLHKTKSDYYKTYLLEKGGYRGAVSQGDEQPYTGLEILGPLEINEQEFKDKEVEMIGEVLKTFQSNNKLLENDFVCADVTSDKQLDLIVSQVGMKRENFFYESSDFNLLGASIPYNIFRKSLSASSEDTRLVCIGFGEGLSVSLAALDFNLEEVAFSMIKTNVFFEEGEVSHQMN